MNIKLVKLVSFLFLFASAQTFAQSSFDVKVGIASPMSDFGSEDQDNEEAGGAATGFNIGLKYTYQLSDNGIGLFAGLDFNYNGLKKDVRDDFEEEFENIGIMNAEYKFYRFINVPFSGGLNYTYVANDQVALFANAGVTANMLKVTDFEIAFSGVDVTSEYDLSSSIGFRAGAGVLFNDQISVAIDYYGLGTHDLNGSVSADGVPSEDIEGDLTVNILTIRVGYTF